MATTTTKIGTGNALDFGLITEPGVYTCKARWDGLECSSMMNGSATVAIGNTTGCSFTVSENVCIEQPVTITYTGNYPATAQYTWYFGGATIISGSGQGPFSVKWMTAGEKHVYLTVKLGNDSCSSTRLVQVRALPTAFQVTGGGTYPQGGTGVLVGLSGSQTGLIYTLFRNQVATTITRIGTGNALDFGLITEPGVYTCKARWDGLECSSMMNGSVTVAVGNSGDVIQICMVTFDNSSSHNRIIWNKPQSSSISRFNIYRETTQNNQYQKIAEIPYSSFSSWVDTIAQPLVRSYKYKLSATYTNQQESDKSPYHKTIHLSINFGYNGYNLMWEHYEGFEFLTYRIYRKVGSQSYQVIDSVASNVTSYTDFHAGSGIAKYYLEIIRPTPCSPTKSGEIASVISNIVETAPYGINEHMIPDLKYSPNPVRDILSVRFQANQSDKCSFFILSPEGKLLRQGAFEAGRLDLDLSAYRSGLYLVKIRNNQSVEVFKVMKL